MNTPKTIKLFLKDGISNGRISCELSNWSGKSYKIPRILLKQSDNKDDLNRTGVYFLFGRDDDNTNSIYIGEAEGIYQRLSQHLASKDFWNEAIVFVSKDENLNKAHIKYLEHRLYQIAVETKRYRLENSSIPNNPTISEADKAEMEEFIRNIRMIVPVLGHKVFEDKVNLEIESKNILSLSGPRGANAQGVVTAEGFVVYKESHFAFSVVNSFQNSHNMLREKLINDNILVLGEEYYILKENFIFTSPSSAAAVVLGRSANGLTEWKNKAGKCLKDIEI